MRNIKSFNAYTKVNEASMSRSSLHELMRKQSSPSVGPNMAVEAVNFATKAKAPRKSVPAISGKQAAQHKTRLLTFMGSIPLRDC